MSAATCISRAAARSVPVMMPCTPGLRHIYLSSAGSVLIPPTIRSLMSGMFVLPLDETTPMCRQRAAFTAERPRANSPSRCAWFPHIWRSPRNYLLSLPGFHPLMRGTNANRRSCRFYHSSNSLSNEYVYVPRRDVHDRDNVPALCMEHGHL